LSSSFLPILNLIEEAEATLYPAFSRITLVNSIVVDLPFVPVMPITFNLLEGKP